jgi:5-(carboxyamino)imidazole ribonucleotide mutase
MSNNPLVCVVMGSQSDWAVLAYTAETLAALGIAHETEIVSAHRTPDKLFQYAEEAEDRGVEIIIAGAGGAAHLPGMLASKTCLPIFGVPMPTPHLEGVDSLLSIMQMPKGIPVGTLAIGKPGAINAALLAAACLANKYPEIKTALKAFRKEQTQNVLANPDPKKG